MRFRFIALLSVIALATAACGSDSPNETTATTVDATTTSVEETTTVETAKDSTTTVATTTTTPTTVAPATTPHDMDHDMEHGEHPPAQAAPPNGGLAHPLALLPNGIIDPSKVDLAGVAGVTRAQRRYAENLLISTINTIQKWNSYDQAIADGFLSIGDGFTGEEHVIHWDWIDDATWLDPSQPESLVYKVTTNAQGQTVKTLEAAMFLLPNTFNLSNVPNDGGALMQYHIHDDLCFTSGAAPKVAGIRPHGGACTPPLVAFNPNPMIHVWIRANACGPFAALLGVGGGQILEGEEVNCLHEHGSI